MSKHYNNVPLNLYTIDSLLGMLDALEKEKEEGSDGRYLTNLYISFSSELLKSIRIALESDNHTILFPITKNEHAENLLTGFTEPF